MKSTLYTVIYILSMVVISAWLSWCFSNSQKYNQWTEALITGSQITTWQISSWTSATGLAIETGQVTWTSDQQISKYTASWNKSVIINNSVVNNSLYPLIQINDQVSNVIVYYEVDFTDYFKKRYKSYLSVPAYFFAFKFFIGDIQNWWFYNVIRNQIGGVSNSNNEWLKGAKLWKEINWGFTWSIPWKSAKIAKEINEYWYGLFSIENMINKSVWKKLRIWWYLSSTKDMKWRNFTLIKSIKIEYVGTSWAIQFVE